MLGEQRSPHHLSTGRDRQECDVWNWGGFQLGSYRDPLKVPDQNTQLLQGWRSLNVKRKTVSL